MLSLTALFSLTRSRAIRASLKHLLPLGLIVLLLCGLAASRSYAQNGAPDPSVGTETVGKYTITVVGSGTSQAQEWDMASAGFSVSVTYTADGTDASKDIASQSYTLTVSGATMDTASGPSALSMSYGGDGSSATFAGSTTVLPGISTSFQCLGGPSATLGATVTMQDKTVLGTSASVNVALICLGS